MFSGDIQPRLLSGFAQAVFAILRHPVMFFALEPHTTAPNGYNQEQRPRRLLVGVSAMPIDRQTVA
jgi:hypothetical protein